MIHLPHREPVVRWHAGPPAAGAQARPPEAASRRRTGSRIGARLAVLLGVFAAGGCAAARGGPASARPDVDPRAWAAQGLARLTLEEKVGQLIVAELPGGFANEHGAALRDARRLIREVGVGGFLVGPAPPLETAAKLNALQEASPLPLLMAAPYDGGARGVLPQAWFVDGSGQSDGGTIFPGNMGLAATGQPLHAELAGRVAAREARAVGIQWLLAPIVALEAGSDPAVRDAGAFSDDPGTTAAFASSFIRGAASARVLTTLRDYPAAGTSAAGGALPMVSAGREELERRDLYVFRHVLQATGADAIMLGNVLAPGLSGEMETPVALSAPAVDLLRGPLGYDGLVVSGRLDDPALWRVPGYGPAEIAVRALAAGADVLLTPSDPALAQRAIVAAVRSGRLPYNRIDASVRRVLAAKARVGLAADRLVPLDSVASVVSAPEHRIVAGEIAAQSIVLARDSAGIVPLDPRQVHHLAVIAVAPPGEITAGHALAEELRATYGAGTSFDRLDARTADALVDAAVARAGLADAVVIAVFEPLPPFGFPAQAAPPGRVAGPQDFEAGAVSRHARRLAQRLAAVSRRLVVISFGDPFAPAALAGPGAYLLAWQPHGTDAQVAAARALSGRTPITGRLPVRLPGQAAAVPRPALDRRLARGRAAEAGMDSAALARIDPILLGAIHAGASPGAAIAVGRHGRIVKLRGYGRIDYRRDYADVTDSTLYDLASLTKVIGTTTALAMLVERGLLELDAPVGRYVPEWNTSAAKRAVTLRNLLLHNSGLAAYGPLYRELRGREQYRQRIARMDLSYAPGTRTVYSDFGVILLGLIIEQVTGTTLDVFLERELFAPLGMRDTGFNPYQWPYTEMEIADSGAAPRELPPFVQARIAPTELDPARCADLKATCSSGTIHGQVHDENAWAIGGVAGHAGLFSSARDLAVFAQMLLDNGYYDGRRLLDPGTVAAFTLRAAPETSRALGWDTPSGQSSAGEYFSARSYGHTGFTGTSIWIDPERDLFVILLTNRVNPTRENQRHVPLRRAVANAVQLAVRDVTVVPRELLDMEAW